MAALDFLKIPGGLVSHCADAVPRRVMVAMRSHTWALDKLEVRRHGPWSRLSACWRMTWLAGRAVEIAGQGCRTPNAGPRRTVGRVGDTWVMNRLGNLFYVRGIGFQPVESKPIPLAQNPPPTHDLPRRGYFSQPGVAASAATPGQRPPRATSTLSGLCSFRRMENRRIHMSVSRRTKQS